MAMYMRRLFLFPSDLNRDMNNVCTLFSNKGIDWAIKDLTTLSLTFLARNEGWG